MFSVRRECEEAGAQLEPVSYTHLMRAGGFEVGGIALGVLMKVDGVLAGRKIVKVKLETDSGSLLPEHDGCLLYTSKRRV